MSDPIAKARRSRIKDKKQLPTPDGECSGKRRKKSQSKPWVVIGPYIFASTNPEGKTEMEWHRAATKALAEEWAEKEKRSRISKTLEFKIEYKEKK